MTEYQQNKKNADIFTTAAGRKTERRQHKMANKITFADCPRPFWIVRDGQIIGETGTEADALAMVRAYQERETHPFLKANFQIVRASAVAFVPYPTSGKKAARR